MPKTVALYVRISSEHEEAARPVEAQLDAIRDYAERNDMQAVSHFVDKYGSREEFDWMMAQATSDNPPFLTVMVYSLDRLTRSATELMALTEELAANGLEIISITQPTTEITDL